MITAKRYRVHPETKKLIGENPCEVKRNKDQFGNFCMKFDGEAVWQVKTHDQENGERYQIAFSSDRPAEEVVLRIEGPAVHPENEQIEALRQDKLETGETVWRQLYDRGDVQDYVTSAGVFRVIEQSRASGEITDRTPWIYCLPSCISVAEYQLMLQDLLRLHDELVRRSASKVGIGGDSIEDDWAQKLVAAVHQIQRADTGVTQLQKRYVRTNIKNIKRFDNRVIRSYIANGLTGIAEGVQYEESNDVHENRVIKRAIRLIMAQLRTTSQLLDQEEIPNKIQPSEMMNAKWKEKRRSQLEKKEDDLNKQKDTVRETLLRLEALLQEDWFQTISDLESNVFPIICTPVFARNKGYATILRLLNEFFKIHPTLQYSIDTNAFGVKKTCDIYELWVLYKMLIKLDVLGFKPITGEINKMQSLLDNFRMHITGEKMPIGFCVKLEKKLDNHQPISITFGYNYRFEHLGKKYIPDYVISVQYDKKSNLYIMDAKYKPYFRNQPLSGTYSLQKEITEVAYEKYVVELSKILKNKEKCRKYDIRGSYLIVASIDHRKAEIDDISNNRLLYFPASEDMTNRHEENAAHKYGAIQLTPSSGFELDTLFKLIFEYKESEEYRPEEAPNLDYCWVCGRKMELELRSHTVARDKICKCGEYRVETHCRACGKLLIKHALGNYHQMCEKWNAVCPECEHSL